ncbi:MAG: hypothetical protein HY291_12775 [Planctomycetes bacterium]|nr:hypothetical protein [Planctomycetota bacterium]
MPNGNPTKVTLWCAAALCTLLCMRPAAAEEPKPAAPTDAQIKEWIKQLGDAEFQKRNDARAALLKAGKAAIADLKAAQESTDPEVKKIAGDILVQLQWLSLPENIDYLKLFPDESILSVCFTHVEKTLEASKQTAVGKLAQGEDLKPIFELLAKKMTDKGGEKGKAGVVELPNDEPEKHYRAFLEDTGFLKDGVETDENGLRVLAGPRPQWAPPEMDIPTGAIALAGHHLIVAPNLSSLKKVAASILKPDGGNLGDSTLFKKTQPHLGAAPDMLFTMNMQAYLRMLTAMAGPQAGEALGKMGYDGMEFFAYATSIKGDLFEERFALVMNEKAKGIGKLYEMAWASNKLLKEKLAHAPADAVLVMQNYMDGSVIFEFATAYMKQMAQLQEGMGGQGMDLSKSVEELEGKIGVKLADLAGCVKGDMVTWAVLTQEEGTSTLPDIGISIECGDEAKAQQLAQGLFVVMQKAPGLFAKEAPAVKPKDGDPPPANPPPEKAEDAVLKIDRDGRSYFTENSKGPLVTSFAPRQAVPYRFTWSAKGNRVLLASSAPYLNKRLSQLEKGEAGLQPVKFLPPDAKLDEVKTLVGVDVAALLEYGAKLGLPLLAARLEQDPDLQEKITALSQKNGVFKSIPPLSATTGVPQDGVTVSVVRSPLPYMPTAVGAGILFGLMNAGRHAAPQAAPAPPPPAPGF